VNLRARLRPGVTPADLQNVLAEELQTALRSEPRITLEEIDGDEVVVLIAATPEHASDGPQLATELLAAVTPQTRSDRDRREDRRDGGGNGPVARRDEPFDSESPQTVER
jgi:hypothetical protein